jgi:hypothetical protein
MHGYRGRVRKRKYWTLPVVVTLMLVMLLGRSFLAYTPDNTKIELLH